MKYVWENSIHRDNRESPWPCHTLPVPPARKKLPRSHSQAFPCHRSACRQLRSIHSSQPSYSRRHPATDDAVSSPHLPFPSSISPHLTFLGTHTMHTVTIVQNHSETQDNNSKGEGGHCISAEGSMEFYLHTCIAGDARYGRVCPAVQSCSSEWPKVSKSCGRTP